MVIVAKNILQIKEFPVLEIGYTEKNDVRKWGPGIRDKAILHIITRGAGFFNGVLLKKGDYYLSAPYENLTYYPTEENGWDYCWMFFAKDGMFNLLSKINITDFGIGKIDNIDEFLQNKQTIFDDIENYYKNYEVTEIAKLMFGLGDVKIRKRYTKNEYCKIAKDYVELNLSNTITAEKVAKKLNISSRYLYKIFKQEYGISLKEYIDNLRFEKAKIFIERSNFKFTEIAYRIGIPDVFSFSRFFKNKTGYSPTEYRKKIKEE